jgi:hypothetical protein
MSVVILKEIDMRKFFYFFFMFLITSFFAKLQAADKVDLGQATRLEQLPEWRRKSLSWTTQSWSGDDHSYVTIRRDIDKAVAQGRTADELLKEYEKAVSLGSSEPKAIFRWAYAAWLARNRFTGYREQLQRIDKPRAALLRVTFPRSYEFARLLFLMQAWESDLPQFLIEPGYKLLRKNPQDYDVKYYLTRLLATSSRPEHRQQALTNIREFVKSKPRKPSYQALLGGIYYRQWRKNQSPSDATKAIDAYKKYLQLAPMNDEWRPQAQRLIKRLQRR